MGIKWAFEYLMFPKRYSGSLIPPEPFRKRLRYVIRMLIADSMDRFDDTCWAKLVLWANSDQPLLEAFFLRHSADPLCDYCGKCPSRFRGKREGVPAKLPF